MKNILLNEKIGGRMNLRTALYLLFGSLDNGIDFDEKDGEEE